MFCRNCIRTPVLTPVSLLAGLFRLLWALDIEAGAQRQVARRGVAAQRRRRALAAKPGLAAGVAGRPRPRWGALRHRGAAALRGKPALRLGLPARACALGALLLGCPWSGCHRCCALAGPRAAALRGHPQPTGSCLLGTLQPRYGTPQDPDLLCHLLHNGRLHDALLVQGRRPISRRTPCPQWSRGPRAGLGLLRGPCRGRLALPRGALWHSPLRGHGRSCPLVGGAGPARSRGVCTGIPRAGACSAGWTLRGLRPIVRSRAAQWARQVPSELSPLLLKRTEPVSRESSHCGRNVRQCMISVHKDRKAPGGFMAHTIVGVINRRHQGGRKSWEEPLRRIWAALLNLGQVQSAE
mmetsp:Transcript_65792/g.186810  ORF Transcript_65792/g.186810 Transcript_65792/m.186810 type:complete len:353 (-) Transcript_65792:1341-2399(-)